MNPEAIVILASRAPSWWVVDRVEYLRKMERAKIRADESCKYREREDLALIVEAQYEYADAILSQGRIARR